MVKPIRSYSTHSTTLSQAFRRPFVLAGLLLCVLAGACTASATGSSTGSAPPAVPTKNAQVANGDGIHKIEHVVVIMQENRSFDSYFGTYPGADGLPRTNGRLNAWLSVVECVE